MTLSGFIHVKNTRNNTIATLTDLEGNAKFWMSGGRIGFKGSRKSTKYAAEIVAEKCAGKQNIVRSIYRTGLKVLKIEDRTPVPFNGCRLPKKPRI